MKIHYLSDHSILEYLEVKLFSEMGHEVFSNGAYLDPAGSKLLPRPGIPSAKYFPEYESLARQYPKTHLPPELIQPFDVIFIMNRPEWITENWNNIKHKRVVWRSIGQSTRTVENMIRKMRYEGMKIVRWSNKEQNIPDYLGADSVIYSYQDPQEFTNWNGTEKRVINFTQSLKGRRTFCHYDDLMQLADGFPTQIFGSGNDDLGGLNGGDLPYELMKGQMRDNRVFIYGGTWPAPYTLAFQEAMMTGIPIVSIGKKLAENIPSIPERDKISFFEIPDFIEHAQNGFYSDDITELRGIIHRLLEDYEYAKQISEKGRAKAISVFGKNLIKNLWAAFFATL